MRYLVAFGHALCLAVFLGACGTSIPETGRYASLDAARHVTPSDGRLVALTAARWRELQQVNAAVNASIIEVSDLEHYGRPDVWTLPFDGKGDCEDFALLKRKLLMERGWPARALSIAVGVSSRGEAHAVLALASDRGELILDNLTDEILPTERTGHKLLSRQVGKSFRASTGEITPTPSVDLPVAAVIVRSPAAVLERAK